MVSELAESQMDQPAPKSRRSRHIAWVTITTGLLAVVVLVWTGRMNRAPRRIVAASPSPMTSSKPRSPELEDPDASLKQLLLGTWEREYHGSWTMNVLDGGTGTLIIKPTGIWGALIGEKVLVNLNWSVTDGRAELVSLSGEPEAAFAAAKLFFGERRIRNIKELTLSRLVFLDEEDDSETEWTRSLPASE